MKLTTLIVKPWQWFNAACEILTPFGDLLIRFWIAKVFFLSGLAKIQSFTVTTMLFQSEYQVPQLSPDCAATLAIIIELAIPPLLLVGLLGRLPAFILFFFNIAAVACYPFLWTTHGAVGLREHTYWGLLLLMLLLHGPGKITLDNFIVWCYRKFKQHSV